MVRGCSAGGLDLREGHRVRDDGAPARPRPWPAGHPRPLRPLLPRLDWLAEAEHARFAPASEPRDRSGRRPPGRPGPRRAVPAGEPVAASTIAGRRKQPLTGQDDESLLKWLILAYPDRVVKRRGSAETGVMVGGRGVRLSPRVDRPRGRAVPGARSARGAAARAARAPGAARERVRAAVAGGAGARASATGAGDVLRSRIASAWSA